MPRTARVLTRAARDRTTRTGTSYTQARTEVVAIHRLAVEDDITFAQRVSRTGTEAGAVGSAGRCVTDHGSTEQSERDEHPRHEVAERHGR